jgi:quercetin dioxygenase-like cupin family protein
MMRSGGHQVDGRSVYQGGVMRRLSVLLSVIVVVLLGSLALIAQPIAVAQEATPAADEMGEGLTFTLLGLVPSTTLPSAASVQVARAEFAPGAGFPFDPSDPNGALVIVESGSLTVRVEEQAWTISRGAALQQAMEGMEATGTEPDMASVVEEVAMGEDATLEAGDVAHIPGNLTGEVRNNGQEPTSVLIVLIGPEGMMMGGEEATPTS